MRDTVLVSSVDLTDPLRSGRITVHHPLFPKNHQTAAASDKELPRTASTPFEPDQCRLVARPYRDCGCYPRSLVFMYRIGKPQARLILSSLRAATLIATPTRFRLYTAKPLIPCDQPYRYCGRRSPIFMPASFCSDPVHRPIGPLFEAFPIFLIFLKIEFLCSFSGDKQCWKCSKTTY